MQTPAAEAFALLTLPDAVLSTPAGSQRGTLVLECVTLATPTAISPDPARDVVLVLRVNTLEVVVDPARQITLADQPGAARLYTFHRTADEPYDLTLALPWAGSDRKADSAAADQETFDGVLAQYARFTPGAGAHVEPTTDAAAYEITDASEDLRGRLVLVDEINGEVLGAVGDQKIHADPVLARQGHEHDAVVFDVGSDGEIGARELFAQAIPPGQHNVITRGASILSTGITRGTNLLTSGITSASNLYISRATPHPSASPTIDGAPSAPPPAAIQWLTSAGTRRGLETAQTYTGKARVVSSKTVDAVQNVIARVAAAGLRQDKGKGRETPAIPLRAPQPVAAPPSMFDPNLPNGGMGQQPPPYGAGMAPPLPPRKSADSSAPPLYVDTDVKSRSAPPTPAGGPLEKLGPGRKFIIAAKLIAATVGDSGKKIADVGSERLIAAVNHKYGAEAAHSTRILTGTARNVALVYIDVTGLGRRALLKSAGKHIYRARIKGRNFNLRTNEAGQVIEAQPVDAMPMPSPAVPGMPVKS